MLLLGLDFETTGLHFDTDRIIEVGAVLWDTDHNAPLGMLSQFMHDASYPELSPEIQAITGIRPEHLARLAKPPAEVFADLYSLMKHATIVVAHNGAGFDAPMMLAELARQKISGGAWMLPWLDTMTDVPYPERVSTRKLGHLAADHGFLNPFPHRALFDVLTMMTLLGQYDIHEVIQLAAEPNVVLVAETQLPWKDKGVSTNLAKARGYRWDGAQKTWSKTVKQSRVESELAHKEFPVTVIQKAL